MSFKNPYALLNYDMDNMKSTPEFEKVTESIDNTLDELANEIKSKSFDIDPDQIGYCFYGNLHWGSIGENRKTGDSRIDELISGAIKKLKVLAKSPEAKGAGMGDTHTDECIAYALDKRMAAEPVMHGTLLNRK